MNRRRSLRAGGIAAATIALLLAIAMISNLPIPLLNPAVHHQSPSNGGTAGTASAVREKLSRCVQLWNHDGEPEYVRPTEEGVLVTTDPKGNCVIAFDQFAGGADGSVGAWAWVRSPEGEWEVYVSSTSPDIERRVAESKAWELQREGHPNAFVGRSPSYLEFADAAPLPISAKANPPLVLRARRSSCASVMRFTGGTAGSFSLAVQEAAGITCYRAEQLASKILYHPGGLDGFECSLRGTLTAGTVDCGKGFDSFKFITYPTYRTRTATRSPSGKGTEESTVSVICLTNWEPTTGAYSVEPHSCDFHRRGAYPAGHANIEVTSDLSWLSWTGKAAIGEGMVGVSSVGLAPVRVRLDQPGVVCGHTVFTQASFTIRETLAGRIHQSVGSMALDDWPH